MRLVTPQMLFSLGGLELFLSGRLLQALQHVVTALRLDPGHKLAQQLCQRVKDVEKLGEDGNLAFKNGELEEAISKYDECLEVRLLFLYQLIIPADCFFSEDWRG